MTTLSNLFPLQTLGEPVVAACVEEGTHYVDITGGHVGTAHMVYHCGFTLVHFIASTS